MIRIAFREVLTADEYRLVRNWTWGTVAFYCSLASIVVAFASWFHQPAAGVGDVAKVDPRPIAVVDDKLNR